MKTRTLFVALLLVGLVCTGSRIAFAAPRLIEDNPRSITGTVRFWTAFGPDEGMGDMVKEFNKVYPNVKVVINKYSNTSNGNMGVDTALMAGGQIDVLQTFGANRLILRASAGLLMPLDELLKRDGIDLVQEWGTDAYRYNGMTYSLPMGGVIYYVAINMNAWKEAGLGDIPTEWTWDEYLEACRKMTTKSRFGGSEYHTPFYAIFPLQQVLGKDVLYNEKGLSNFDHPLFREALQRKYNAEVIEKIWFPLARYRSEGIQTQNVLLSGAAASGIISNFTRFVRDTKTYPRDCKFAFAPYPTVKPGQDNYMSGPMIYSHLGISSSCKDKQAAWAFAKWYSTYGAIYLSIAGHTPTWRRTDVSKAVELIFGSYNAAEKLIDIESFKRVVLNVRGLSYVETKFTAYPELVTMGGEVVLRCMNGEITVDQAIRELKERGDKAIRDAL